MRTKQILTTMVLPALFAACTADDFVENNNVNIEGRTLLNPITFNVGAPADTRFAWDEANKGNWVYEDADAFSAFLVDGDKDVLKDALLTNYIYKSKDGRSFTTTSQMVEGTYWFYAPAPEDKNTRDLIAFKLNTAQDAEYYKSEDAQVFFTSLYKLTKDDDPQNIDLTLTNYYGRAVFPLTNNLEGDVKINQIILEAEGEVEPFVVEGNISVEALKDYMYAFNEDGEMVSARNLDDDEENDEDLADLQKRLRRADVAAKGAKATKTLVLNLGEGVTIAEGKTETFTMLVPRTDAGVSCTVKIITDRGLANITSANTSNYIKNKQFLHNGLMPVFGQKNDGSFKAYSIGKLEDMEGKRYVTTYEGMMDLINTINGDIDVYNLGDWAVDAAMAKAIENSDSYVKFTQPITVKDAKAAVSLKKVDFANVTVAKDTEVSFDKTNVSKKENSVTEMTIEKGATVVLNAGKFGKIANGGDLTVAENAAAKESLIDVTSTGTLTLEDNAKVKVVLNAGDLNYTTKKTAGTYNTSNLSWVGNNEMTADLNISIGENVTVNHSNGKLFQTPSKKNVEGKIIYVTNLTNNGTLNLTGSGIAVSGKMENNGTVNVGDKTFGIQGTATNGTKGSINGVAIKDVAVLINYGRVSNATNNGKIVAEEGSHTGVMKGKGEVDNTALADVTAVDGQLVSYTYAEVATVDDLVKVDSRAYNINTLKFAKGLTLDRNIETEEGKVLFDIDRMEFADKSVCQMTKANLSFGLFHVDLIISGNVAFNGFNKDSEIKFKGENKVEIRKNGKLTIQDMKWTAENNDSETGKIGFVTEKIEEGSKDKKGIFVQGVNVTITGAVNDQTNGVVDEKGNVISFSGN